VLQVLWERRAHLVSRASLASRVLVARPARRVLPVHVVLLASKVSRVSEVTMVRLASPARLARLASAVSGARLVFQVPVDLAVPRVALVWVFLALLAAVVLVVSLVFRVLLVARVSLVPMAVTASRASQARMVRMARMARTARSDLLAPLVMMARRDLRVIVANLSCRCISTLLRAMWI